MAIREFEVHSAEEYMKCIAKYRGDKDFFFRGQFREYEDLRCSLAREPGYVENESGIWSEAIELKMDEFIRLRRPVEKLAKMQHYGIPTRLIDFTTDELVALFFAVENDTDSTDAVIYVHRHSLQPLDSKRVRLVALLASLDDYNPSHIARKYFLNYREIITEDEILKYACQNSFIKFPRRSLVNNKRLAHQKGAFLLCGNRVEDGRITRDINSFDMEPDMIIRVPYEYKTILKRQLDVRYKINRTSIYPELMSVAEYLKRKYLSIESKKKAGYHVVKTEDISYDEAARLVISIVMDRQIKPQRFRPIAKTLISKYTEDYDVVWVDIAENYEDYITRDWAFIGLWIDPMLESVYRPEPLENDGGRGYSWEVKEDLPAVIYLPNCVRNDRESQLLEEADLILKEMKRHYDHMVSLFKNTGPKELRQYGYNHGNFIFDCSVKLGNIGRSENEELNSFLNHYEYMAISLYDAVLFVYRDDINQRAYNHILRNYLKDAGEHLKIIEEQHDGWVSCQISNREENI